MSPRQAGFSAVFDANLTERVLRSVLIPVTKCRAATAVVLNFSVSPTLPSQFRALLKKVELSLMSYASCTSCVTAISQLEATMHFARGVVYGQLRCGVIETKLIDHMSTAH